MYLVFKRYLRKAVEINNRLHLQEDAQVYIPLLPAILHRKNGLLRDYERLQNEENTPSTTSNAATTGNDARVVRGKKELFS
jgi:hypothetical protein